jgi:hypothetical protein
MLREPDVSVVSVAVVTKHGCMAFCIYTPFIIESPKQPTRDWLSDYMTEHPLGF